MTGISNEQKSLIHVAKSQLGLEDDIYREILRQEAGVMSAKDISLLGFEKVMKRFKQLGFVSKPKPQPQPEQKKRESQSVNGLATKKEIWKIKQLVTELGWTDNPKRLNGFLKKYAGVERVEWLTHAKAWRVIEALKKLVARQESNIDTGK